MTNLFSEAPCATKNMKNGGKVEKDELKVTPGAEDTTQTVTLKDQPKDEPQWEKLTVQTTDAKSVEVTPIGKDGKPSGPTTTKEVTPDSKTTEIVFPQSVTASGFVVKPTPVSADAKPTVDAVSAVACIERQGIYRHSII